jgi:hypothetical protein
LLVVPERSRHYFRMTKIDRMRPLKATLLG